MPKGNPPRDKKKSKPSKPITTDPRFTHIHNDPRFAPAPRKDAKLTIDKRFQRMLSDGDFTQKASVDRYGRRIGREAGKEEIKRYYNIEEDEGEGGEGVREAVYDPARGEGVLSTDESSTDDDETEEEDELEAGEDTASGLARNGGDIDVPIGEVSRRFAVVNLDWDNVRAVDLLKAFSGFVTGSGRVVSVTIYPSEFGKERMEKEEMEGPPTDIFRPKGNARVIDSEDSGDDQEEVTEKTIVQEDRGEEFDSGKLRNYQLERLRYFYAVVDCDSPSTAKCIYDQCDGAEYEATANFFDLRFIPDDTSFEGDKPREKCTEVPENYRPIEFTTDALQHSKVKLTWDEDDQHRKLATKRAFSRRDIEDMELRDYLASSDNESGAEDAAASKEKYRALLSATGLGKKDKLASDMEVTFTSGLSENARGGKVIETEELEETTIERYARKEKERRQKRKEKMQAAREGNPTKEGNEESIPKEAPTSLGFDDPFFDDDAPASAAQERKEKKRKDKETRAKEAAEAESKRAELELLMVDGDEGLREDGTKLRHFDMKQIVKAEKNKGKKNKKRKHGRPETQDLDGTQDGFEIDVKDPRFAAVYNNHEFAIDPTNPRFVKTKAMSKLMEERRNRARRRNEEGPEEEDQEPEEAGRRLKIQKIDKDNVGKGKKDELARLIQSLKNKSAKKKKK